MVIINTIVLKTLASLSSSSKILLRKCSPNERINRITWIISIIIISGSINCRNIPYIKIENDAKLDEDLERGDRPKMPANNTAKGVEFMNELINVLSTYESHQSSNSKQCSNHW